MSVVSDEDKTGTAGASGQMAGGDPRLDKLVRRLPPRMGDTCLLYTSPSPRDS